MEDDVDKLRMEGGAVREPAAERPRRRARRRTRRRAWGKFARFLLRYLFKKMG